MYCRTEQDNFVCRCNTEGMIVARKLSGEERPRNFTVTPRPAWLVVKCGKARNIYGTDTLRSPGLQETALTYGHPPYHRLSGTLLWTCPTLCCIYNVSPHQVSLYPRCYNWLAHNPSPPPPEEERVTSIKMEPFIGHHLIPRIIKVHNLFLVHWSDRAGYSNIHQHSENLLECSSNRNCCHPCQ